MLKELYENDFDQIFTILEEAFPPSERRTKADQRKLMDLEEYTIFGLKEAGDLIGFVAEWEGPEYRFVEHFVVNEAFRGNGTGTKLLNEYHDLSDKPVVLEVEPPEDEIQKKRIKFYKRNGYHLTDYTYIQPTINADIKGVPLVLMTFPDRLTDDRFLSVKDWLFRTVYDKEMIK